MAAVFILWDGNDENPLISHIDTILEDPDRLEEMISYLPKLDMAAERLKSVQYRLRRTGLFARMHKPLKRDFEVAALINEMICEGYVDRAPNARFWETHRQKVENFLEAVRRRRPSLTADRCMGLMGIPGIGKSRLLKLLLGLIYEAIQHSDAIQVPVVFVECSSDRKPGSLARKIIRAVLRAAGETREKLYEGKENEDLLGTAASVCNMHFVGLIVVDDAQNAVSHAKKPRTDIVDLLVELSNELGIPILFVGTPKAVRLLGREMRSARKILGPTWEQFAADDPDWILLMNTIWEYQWNKTYTPRDNDLRERFYKHTQGVPAFLMRLLHFTERRTILLGGDERITTTIVDEAFELYFGPVKPMIRAWESKDPALIDLFEDLPKNFSLEEMLALEAEDIYRDESKALRRTIHNARKRVGRKASNRLALEGALVTPSLDAEGPSLAHRVVVEAIKAKRDPVEALVAAGLIVKDLVATDGLRPQQNETQ